MSTVYNTAYDEMLAFLSQPRTRDEVLGFRPSAFTTERIIYLVEARRNHTMTACEEAELLAFLDAALFIHMQKVQAEKATH